MRTSGWRPSTLPATAWLAAGLLALPATACSQQAPRDIDGRAAPSGDADRQDAPPRDADPQEAMNTLTEAEREAGWRLLFDGESLDRWRGYRMESLPDGWRAVDGMLARVAPAGDIITREAFGSFELSFEWRVEEGGNSGVLYLVTEEADRIWEAAPEMQILDDANHRDGRSPATSAGAAYALYPAPRGVVKPAGEWNSARVVVDGTRVEHWLNGQKLLEYELGSEDFDRRVAESKFAEWPLFAQARSGHIGLQDHGDPVWYRNIKIREIQ